MQVGERWVDEYSVVFELFVVVEIYSFDGVVGQHAVNNLLLNGDLVDGAPQSRQKIPAMLPEVPHYHYSLLSSRIEVRARYLQRGYYMGVPF